MNNTLNNSGPFQVAVSPKGKETQVPAVQLHGYTIVRKGKWLRLASVKDEAVMEGDGISFTEEFLKELKSSGLDADVFSCFRMPPFPENKVGFSWEEENLAVIETDSFKTWWDGLPQEARKNVRRANKRDVVVREVAFDDDLVAGIQSIYDETPVRQGKPFWHYKKAFEKVKEINGTYMNRSWFVGAYYEEELIGFIKVIDADGMAILIQVIAMDSHRDKRPMNALISHTVELCEKKGLSHLVYANWTYGKKKEDSLSEFKRRNGFKEFNCRRYYLPLSAKGRFAVKVGLHQGIQNIIPTKVVRFLLEARSYLLKQWVKICVTSKKNRK